MAAREGGIDQLAAIGVARVDRELVAIFDRGDDLVDVREVELWVDALRVHVERDGDEAGVAGALAVAEQAALDAVAAREQSQLGRRDAGAAGAVGVQADDRRPDERRGGQGWGSKS